MGDCENMCSLGPDRNALSTDGGQKGGGGSGGEVQEDQEAYGESMPIPKPLSMPPKAGRQLRCDELPRY